MKHPISAHSLPDLIATIRRHVAEDMAPEDVTAHELVEHLEMTRRAAECWRNSPGEATARELIANLDMTWCAAERWRIERYEPDWRQDDTLARA